jgi:phosphatidyl-myo-inositol dimannoside synthase
MDRLVRHWGRVRPRVVTFAAPGGGRRDEGPVEVVRVLRPAWTGRRGSIGLINAAAVVQAARHRPDLVLSGHVNVSPAALALGKMLHVPYVQYVHGREVVVRPRLSRRALEGAAAVVAVSRYSAELAMQCGAEPACVHQIPPGVDVVESRGSPGDGPPTVVTVTRLEERYKGIDVLIRAMPLVRARVPGARLVVVGHGHMRSTYVSLAAALGLNGSVVFPGSVSDEERNRFLDCGHVFAMTSRLSSDGGGEGFGIVYLEAGVHGLPVVAGDVAGARDAVVDGETGLLVDPSDHLAVAEAISELLTNPALAQRLGRAGAQRAREHSWPVIARRVEDLLLEVAG